MVDVSRYSPQISRSVLLISPTVAYDSTHSSIRGKRFSLVVAACSSFVSAAVTACASRRSRSARKRSSCACSRRRPLPPAGGLNRAAAAGTAPGRVPSRPAMARRGVETQSGEPPAASPTRSSASAAGPAAPAAAAAAVTAPGRPASASALAPATQSAQRRRCRRRAGLPAI